MSAKPSMSASTESAARAGNHPLRPISFGTPAVTVDRREDGTIYLRPKAQLSDYPVRLTDRLHHWAEGRARSRLHGGAKRRAGLAADHLCGAAGVVAAHRLRAARPRPLGREAGRHSLRQFDRSRADRVRRALCRHSLLPGIAGLFAGVARLRQARLSDEAADARPRLCGRCHQIRRRAGRQRIPGNRDRGVVRRGAGARRHQPCRPDGHAVASAP